MSLNDSYFKLLQLRKERSSQSELLFFLLPMLVTVIASEFIHGMNKKTGNEYSFYRNAGFVEGVEDPIDWRSDSPHIPDDTQAEMFNSTKCQEINLSRKYDFYSKTRIWVEE